MATTHFDIPEESVALRLGLSRKQVAENRGPEGGRWAFGPGRRVLWCLQGIALLEEQLFPGSSENGVPCANPARVLTVLNTRCHNRRVMLASNPENGAGNVTVYLGANGDASRFLPGMRILARHHRGAAWIFEGNPDQPQQGRRMPRAVGRW